jgi:hypothetical protein
MPATRAFGIRQPIHSRPASLVHWARADKLAWIERQIANGELVIRQATADERERYGIAAAATFDGA